MHWLKQIGVLAVTASVIAGSVVLVSVQVGAGRIADDLLNPDFIWVIPLVLGQAAAYLGYAIAYKFLFGLSFGTAARRTLHGFSPLVTLGGFSYDTRIMGRAAVHKVAALAVVEYILLAPAVLAAALYALAGGQSLPANLTIPWVAGVPAGAAAAVTIVLGRRRLYRPLVAAIDKLLAEFQALPWRNWPGILFGTAVYWVCELVVLASALKLFNAHLGIDALIVAYATGYVLTRRSLPAGLAGFTIVLMMIVLHWCGVPYARSFLSTYSYLAINIITPLAYLLIWKIRGRFPARP